jgi:hypothetical protein
VPAALHARRYQAAGLSPVKGPRLAQGADVLKYVGSVKGADEQLALFLELFMAESDQARRRFYEEVLE